MKIDYRKYIIAENLKHERIMSKLKPAKDIKKPEDLGILAFLKHTKKEREANRKAWEEYSTRQKIEKENAIHERKIKELELKWKAQEPDADIKKGYQEAESYSWLKNKPIGKFRSQGKKAVMVFMELDNGDFDFLIVNASDSGFKYQGGSYIFDDSLKFYVRAVKMYCYMYHQGMSMPVRLKIAIKKVRDAMSAAGLDEVEYATNPTTLQKFLVSKVIEMILKGAELDRWMRMMFWLVLFTLIISGITLLLMLGHTGVFQQVAGGVKPPG